MKPPQNNKYRYFILFLALLVSCNNSKLYNTNNTKKEMDIKEKALERYTIRDKVLSATILTKGAELSSLKTTKLEYIWQADPKVWPRHSPILFPIVGRLVDHEYTYNGNTYPMKQHGFARDNDFYVIEHTSNSITFEQTSTDASKINYPFEFILQVKYTLQKNILNVGYTVKNPSDKQDLYFSIGAHPAFNCPFEPNQKRNEYQLVFDKDLSPKANININGLYEGNTVSVFNKKGIMDLPDNIFDMNSLTFNPNPFSKVTFVHQPSQKKYVSVSFKNFPFLGIWSTDKQSKFVCIEPWHGIADRKDHNKDFTHKEGIIKLPPHQNFACSFSIEIL